MARPGHLKEAEKASSECEYQESLPRLTSPQVWWLYSPAPDDGGPVVPADLRHVAVPGPGRRAQVIAVHRPGTWEYYLTSELVILSETKERIPKIHPSLEKWDTKVCGHGPVP